MSMGITAILANERKKVIGFTQFYRVYENGYLVVDGSTRDVEEKTGIGYDQVGKYAESGKLYKKRYKVEKV